MLQFNDGVSFDTSGRLRIVRKFDGYYVVGQNMMCPVDSYEDGRKLIAQLTKGG